MAANPGATKRARSLRNCSTDAEKRLWSRLRMRQIHNHKFRRQFPLGKYFVDFVCLEARLIVEVDGGQHALRMEPDAQRSDWLIAQGFRVLRFWNTEVLQEAEAVVDVIASALRSRSTPTPALPRKGGG